MRNLILTGGLLLVLSAPLAQEAREAVEPPVVPKGPEGQTIEPEVTIIETEKETIYEYRVRGVVYMVKVKPAVGPAYYLLDTNSDGVLDTYSDDPRNISINQWTLFRW
jgi:hypothetical protein